MRTFADKRLTTKQNSTSKNTAVIRLRPVYQQDVGEILHQRRSGGMQAGHACHERAGIGFMGESAVDLAEFEQAQVGIGEDAGPVSDAAPAQAAAPANDDGAAPDAGPVAAGPDADAPAPAPAAVPAPAVPLAITSTATARAPDGTPDTRIRIGVCETINFSLGGQTVDWSASNGWPSARPALATFSWAAPEVAGTSTITTTDPASGTATTIDMTVVAPSKIDFRRSAVLGGYAAGTAGAGMTADVRVAPRDVNFGWLAIKEDPRPATNVTGYFAAMQAAGANLNHVPNPNFARLDWSNNQSDTAATRPNTLPGPWSAGTWDWQIPTRYRYFNATSAGNVFTTAVQSFRMNAGGGVTVSKQAPGGRLATVSRNP